MSAFLAEYGMFLLKLLSFVVIVGGATLFLIATSKKSGPGERITIRRLNDEMQSRDDSLRAQLLDKDSAKKLRKERNRERKARQRKQAGDARSRIFVLEFKGDIKATATASLREEITTILNVAGDGDQVFLKLENAGGAVHEHGLAASQLLRLKQAGVKLTIVVDKIAASGGYLMACVADRLVAAPFAIIGSIGVIAQLPNFHRFLDERGIDFEQLTAGRFKRTLTMFGENTEEGREKLREELAEVHDLFKDQIAAQRPQIDLDAVATGEHWYGAQALELQLVDELGTSDDLIRDAARDADLYSVSFRRRRSLPERVMGGAESLLLG